MKDFFEKNRIPIAIIIVTLIITVLVRLSNKPTPTIARNERTRTPTPQQPSGPAQRPLIRLPYTKAPSNVEEYAYQGQPETVLNDPKQIKISISKSAPGPQMPEPAGPVQQPVKRINYLEAPKHMGEYACVVGKVDHVHTLKKTATTYLNFCPSYISSPFGAVIFKPNAFKFPLPKRFEGKTVEITGLITSYQGQARIILNDSNQIKIIKRQRTAEAEQLPAKRISYTEGPDHVGEYVCVVGKIDHVHISKKKNIRYLSFYPGDSTRSFGAIIFEPDAFKFPLLKRFEGKTVEITGLIATYWGQAYIILSDPRQIKYISRSSL